MVQRDAVVECDAVVDRPVPAALSESLQAPIRVAVVGRAGAGRRTVARGLSGAGVPVAGPGDAADVDVYVFVETLNVDDRATLASATRPTVPVLNKADLTGFRGDGPMVVSAQRCRELQRATAVPTRPLSALLAVAGSDPAVLDDGLVDGLRTMAAAPDRVPAAARLRLAADLDLFGTAVAVSAVRSGACRDDVAALLRTHSGIGEVCAEIDRAAAAVRYRRLAAVPAARGPGDDVVLTRMVAAAAVLGAAGATGPQPQEQGATPRPDHLRRAVHWQRYAHGPVSPLHRACAMDVARGALRLWARADSLPAR